MLTIKQEKFCLEYAKCGNATQAAREAGYQGKYIGQDANKLLKNPKIQERIDELIEQIQSEKIADIKEMQEALTRIIRQEMQEEIPMVVNNGDWSEIQVFEKKSSIKDIVSAINTLGKMQGAFIERVNVDVEPVVIVNDLKE